MFRTAALSAALLSAALVFAAGSPATAQPPAPLTVVAGSNVAVLDLAELDKMPQKRIVTTTPWTEGDQVFDGVAGPAIAAMAPQGAKEILVTAHNEYQAEIPLADFIAGKAILATRRNGELMPIRAKGPYWVIYNFDEMPPANAAEIEHRSVWQVKSILFR